MRNIYVGIFILLLTPFLLNIYGCQTNSTYPWEWYGIVRGKVTDSVGTPLVGVEISAVGGLKTAKTDTKGLYELKEVPYGDEIVITAKKAGYQTAIITKTIGMGQVVTGVNFVLIPEYISNN